MNTQSDPKAPHICKICFKEIPKSVALSAEGKDYVWYFCGPACYDKFREQRSKDSKTS